MILLTIQNPSSLFLRQTGGEGGGELNLAMLLSGGGSRRLSVF